MQRTFGLHELKRIEDQDGHDCEQASCDDSGYVTSESPTPEEFSGFADRGKSMKAE